MKRPIGGELSVDDNVKLAWPGKGPFGSGTATEHKAIVLAVSGESYSDSTVVAHQNQKSS